MAIQLITKTAKIMERLRREGKVSEIAWSAEKRARFEEELEEIRRESIIKQFRSEQSAAQVVLTC